MATFLDTDVLVYAFDRSAGDKRETALAILGDEDLDVVVSPQVLAEFYVTVTRKIEEPLAAPVAEEFVRNLTRLTVTPLDVDTTVAAIALSNEHRIGFWDAQMVAAASRSGCDTVITERLDRWKRLGGLQVVNPFHDAT